MLSDDEFRRFRAVGASHVCDAMEILGFRRAVIHGFRFLGADGGVMVGRAVTVQQAPKRHPAKATDPLVRHGTVVTDVATRGDVIVIDNGGRLDVASWGENHTMRCQERGVEGLLVNGCIRDASAIRRRGFPVFCLGFNPVKSLWDVETIAINEPVIIGGVQVRAGDLLFGDEDGVVVIPMEAREAVLENAERIFAAEDVRAR